MQSDNKVVHLLYIMALYETADERTKSAVNYLLSLNEETLKEVKRIAYAKDECKQNGN